MKSITQLSFAAVPLASAALVSCTSHKPVEQVQPNIVYIMCDDHAMQAISAYGPPLSRLAPPPNIDRLAAMGMMFQNCFVENSLSTPSRACLMTGEYSHQNGQRQLAEGIDSTHVFFSELLQEVGYQTAIVGKWHMGCEPKGFDYYHILNDQGQYYNPVFKGPETHGEFIQEMGYATDLITDHSLEFLDKRDPNKPFMLMVHHKAPHRNWMPAPKNVGKYKDVNFPMPETFYDDYATRGSAARTQKMGIADFIEMQQDLKYTENMDLKDPAVAASYGGLMGEINRMTPEEKANWDAYYVPRNKEFTEANLQGKDLIEWKFQNYVRDYMAVIQSVDESVGRILDYLEEHNLMDNTMIVYTSDQGFYMGEHGWFDKRFMYEESLHTPLIVSYKGHVKEGSQCSQMVQNIDFAPTFLHLAGIKEKPANMSGRSLVPLLEGEPVKEWRTSIYYHYYDYPAFHLVRKHDGVRTERYKLIHFYGKGGEDAVQENKYQANETTREHRTYQYLKNINYITPDEEVNYNELYDLEKDPHELNNIYGQPGTEEITAELQKILDEYRKNLKVDEY